MEVTALNIDDFIKTKSMQLAFYVRAFWQRRISYSELDLYFWDTMEEWNHIKVESTLPYCHKERVFWHLLHQIHYWPEIKLLNDHYLRSELNTCMVYLEGEGQFPLDCVGVRP